MQSTAFVFVLKSGKGGLLGQGNCSLPPNLNLIPNFTAYKALMIIITWTAGTALVMWLGELITQRGIGNGMSILIFTSVVSRLPYQGGQVLVQAHWFKFTVIIGIALLMILSIVAVESGQRRIPVQFAKRVVGRRMYGGQSTYIPLKVNQSGVIPVIFASSLLTFPALISTIMGKGPQKWVNDHLVGNATTSWFYIFLLRDADSVLLVLLHGDRIQPAAAGRPHPQAGRVHPGHPSRTADRALPREGAEPHHAAGRHVPDRDRAGAAARA